MPEKFKTPPYFWYVHPDGHIGVNAFGCNLLLPRSNFHAKEFIPNEKCLIIKRDDNCSTIFMSSLRIIRACVVGTKHPSRVALDPKMNWDLSEEMFIKLYFIISKAMDGKVGLIGLPTVQMLVRKVK